MLNNSPIMISVILSVLLCISRTVLFAEDLVLVNDAEPKSAIILSFSPSPTEKYAAAEFRKYVQWTAGPYLPVHNESQDLGEEWWYIEGKLWLGKLKRGKPEEPGIKIFIGRTKAAEAQGLTLSPDTYSPDAFRIKANDKEVFITGATDRGTLYGVYTFCEKLLGVRWLIPGPLGEDIRHTMTVSIPEMDIIEEPDFGQRHGGFSGPYYYDWAVRHKIHVWGASVLGMDYKGGTVIGSSGHNWFHLIPGSMYGDDHPEYFGLWEGERTIGNVSGPGTVGQFCSTNPEAVAVAVTTIRNDLEKRPDVEIYSLCPNDTRRFCDCEYCLVRDVEPEIDLVGYQEKVVSDRVWHFFNAVADAFPEKTFYTFAYHNYMNPPVKVKPRPNIMVGITQMWPANYARKIDDPTDELNARFNALLQQWTALHDNFKFYGYTCKTMWGQMPYPVARRAAHDLKYLHSIGVRNFYSQNGGSGRWGHLGRQLYLLAKLWWDIDADPETILDDYYTRLYRSAAPDMAEYYEIMEEALARPGAFLHHSPWDEAPEIFTPVYMERAEHALERAFDRADNSLIHDRIEIPWIAHEFARRYLEGIRLENAYYETKDKETLKEAIACFEELVKFAKYHAPKDAVAYFGRENDVHAQIQYGKRGKHLKILKEELAKLQSQ